MNLVDATSQLAIHGNVGTGARGALLRSRKVVYFWGGSLCDHPDEPIGSVEYVRAIRARHGLSLVHAWAAVGMGGIRAWQNATPGTRNRWVARFGHVNPHSTSALRGVRGEAV